MSIWEYDEEKQLAMEREEGRIQGRIEGKVEGKVEGRVEGRNEGAVLTVQIYQEMGLSLEEAITRTAEKFKMTTEEVENIKVIQ